MGKRPLAFPASLGKYGFLSGGAVGWVFALPDGIALKYVCRGAMEEFLAENKAFDKLERHQVPATIIQSFLRLPGLNFMPRMAQSLERRLHANQERDFPARRCLRVLRLETPRQVAQWAAELAGGLAWLAGVGSAHGDLRPANLLLDQHTHLKLADFDRLAEFGAPRPCAIGPYERAHVCDDGCRAAGCPSLYGCYDAASEQFALAGVVYHLLTGVELYEDRDPEMDALLRRLEMPPMGDAPLERLTVRCWMGGFETLADLAREAALLDGAEGALGGTRLDDEAVAEGRARCQRLLETELADVVPHLEAMEAQDAV